jgi:hypothetical protein
MLALVASGDALMPSLRCLGLPDGVIERFEDRLKRGDLLLSVQCDDHEWADRALAILKETGADGVEVSATAGLAPGRA